MDNVIGQTSDLNTWRIGFLLTVFDGFDNVESVGTVDWDADVSLSVGFGVFGQNPLLYKVPVNSHHLKRQSYLCTACRNMLISQCYLSYTLKTDNKAYSNNARLELWDKEFIKRIVGSTYIGWSYIIEFTLLLQSVSRLTKRYIKSIFFIRLYSKIPNYIVY